VKFGTQIGHSHKHSVFCKNTNRTKTHFSLTQNAQTGSGAHPASYSTVTRVLIVDTVVEVRS